MAQAAATRFDSPWGSFQLQRYPSRRQDPLRAWCAADQLLLDACRHEGLGGKQVGVANDDHGALTLPLQPAWCWTDSALSRYAIEANLRRNGLPAVPIAWSTQCPGTVVDAVVLRIPKQIPYLEYQLALLAGWLPAGTLLLAGGMDKHLSPHTAALIERYFGPTTRHRGQRKARVFSARRNAQPAPATPGWASYDCDVAGGTLHSLPNVFSRDGLDIGSRFLLQQLHLLQPAERAADLACGNGVIGIAALRHGLSPSMYFCDESAMAIASARDNAARLAPPATAVAFHHGDGLADLRQAFDLILCNPPFHLGHTVNEYAGRRLLAVCASHLTPGGSLCLVANRHLDYRPTLRRHFRATEQLAGNRKFVVWRALGG